MTPVLFPESNIVIAEDQPEYQPLPANVTDYPGLGTVVTSCWRLSVWERLRVLWTGRVYLRSLTFGQPLQPQLPSVTFALTEYASDATPADGRD